MALVCLIHSCGSKRVIPERKREKELTQACLNEAGSHWARNQGWWLVFMCCHKLELRCLAQGGFFHPVDEAEEEGRCRCCFDGGVVFSG